MVFQKLSEFEWRYLYVWFEVTTSGGTKSGVSLLKIFQSKILVRSFHWSHHPPSWLNETMLQSSDMEHQRQQSTRPAWSALICLYVLSKLSHHPTLGMVTILCLNKLCFSSSPKLLEIAAAKRNVKTNLFMTDVEVRLCYMCFTKSCKLLYVSMITRLL